MTMSKVPFLCRLWTLTLLPLLHLSVNAAAREDSPLENLTLVSHTEDETQNTCKLYLAESSIPGGGLGIYSGVDVSEGDHLTDNDLPIQVTDLQYHHPGKYDWILHNYYWDCTMTGSQHEGNSVKTALPSFGMLANGHTSLVNVRMITNEKDSINMRRDVDPGAGAVSAYQMRSFSASKFIPRGYEIFADYGENYFAARSGEIEDTHAERDYEIANSIVRKFHKIVTDEKLSPTITTPLYDLIKAVASPEARKALPADVEMLEEAAKDGIEVQSLPNIIRSIEWLEKNGQCIDNLTVKPSTVPQAGRGAFANRDISKGSLIAPAPVAQITNKDHLDMYELVTDISEPASLRRKNDIVVGKQLLLNYCFEHSNSSLLLFPYSPAVYIINHKSDGHNAEIRWSENSRHPSQWLEMPVNEIPTNHAGLIFDIVATRDIALDEEIFLDYGSEWEEAWDEHVREWSPPNQEAHVYLEDFVPEDDFIRTIEEQKVNPYPSNLRTGCFYRYFSDFNYPVTENKITYDWAEEDGEKDTDYLRPCDILERYTGKRGEFFYTVRVYNTAAKDEENAIPSHLEFYVPKMPHGSISFIDRRYSTDQFMKNSFRHPIGLPEGVFPELWMNRIHDDSNADTPREGEL